MGRGMYLRRRIRGGGRRLVDKKKLLCYVASARLLDAILGFEMLFGGGEICYPNSAGIITGLGFLFCGAIVHWLLGGGIWLHDCISNPKKYVRIC